VDLQVELRSWVSANWSTDITVREWWRRLADAGLTAPTWPAPYGRGLSGGEARLVTEALAEVGAISPPQGAVGARLAGPTLLIHGNEEQRARYLPPLLRGEESWCQLFSEPGAGSDLPSLATKAIEDGDGWSIEGQKVWNSGADIARRGLLLARTDPAAPKRNGITYFVLDMDQPGVEARPLRQMNDETRFCEVFIDGARVGAEDVLGAVNDGWRVVRTTLGFERASVSGRAAPGLVPVNSGEKAGHLDRTVSDVLASRHAGAPFTGNAIPVRRLIDLARERGRTGDAVMRQGLARYHSLVEVNRYTQLRIRAASAEGRTPGAEASITKLAVSDICRTSRDVSFSILGAEAMLWGTDAPYGGSVQTVGLASCGVSIGGGTDEVQRNTIAERALGLPRDAET